MENNNRIHVDGPVDVLSYDGFVKWFENLDRTTIEANPITFSLFDFETHDDFVKSLFLAGRHLAKEEDIVVRYSKPYTEDKSTVMVCFQILRSKAKMFFNYLKNNKKSITCTMASNKDVKEAMKFFNSLGVKAEGMESLKTKENDYASILRDVLSESEKSAITMTIEVEHDYHEDVDYLMMTYDLTDNDSDFMKVKEHIKKEILRI